MAGRPRSGRGQGVRLDRWVKTDEINSNSLILKVNDVVKLASSLAPPPAPARQSGTGLAYVARPVLLMVPRSMSFLVSSSMPPSMYVLLQLICRPQADAGLEKLRLKEGKEARATWVENKEQETESKKSRERPIGIFVPIRDAVCTPGWEINYVEG